MGQYGALLGGLGSVLFAFGLLSALLAAFQPATDWGWVWGNLVLGAALIAAGAFANVDALRERMSSGEAKRAGRYGTSAILTALLGLALLAMIGFMTARYSKRFDWSETGVHTLSEQTVNVLEGLDEDVAITAFFNPLDGPQVRDLLDRYDYASDRVSLQFADPTARPDLVEALGVKEQDLARGLVAISTPADSVEITEEFSEAQITNALMKLTRGGGRKVYFLEGHGEKPFEGEGAGELTGMERAKQALENETYKVEGLLLASLGAVPADADAVIVAGPTRPLFEPEHPALRNYVDGGGALLVMLDPRSNSDIGGDLASLGVEVGDDVIVDQQLALFGRATTPFAGKYAQAHPITRGLREPVLFHVARSVQPAPGGAAAFETIVWTGESSWAERDLAGWSATGRAAYDEPDDLLGPVPIALAGELPAANAADGTDPANAASAESAAKRGRIVVVGDSDFANNEHIEGLRNRDFFVNAVNWLVGDVEHIAVRPNLARKSRFQPTADEFRRVQYLSLFVLPEAIALIGVFAWWTRRAPGR